MQMLKVSISVGCTEAQPGTTCRIEDASHAGDHESSRPWKRSRSNGNINIATGNLQAMRPIWLLAL
jgi:hypothetical protein